MQWNDEGGLGTRLRKAFHPKRFPLNEYPAVRRPYLDAMEDDDVEGTRLRKVFHPKQFPLNEYPAVRRPYLDAMEDDEGGLRRHDALNQYWDEFADDEEVGWGSGSSNWGSGGDRACKIHAFSVAKRKSGQRRL